MGKTIYSIRNRHNGHRGNIRHGTEAFVMYDYFCGINGHGLNNMIIKPIEICTKENINKRERYWIAELNTVFPYGLNMDANFCGIKNASFVLYCTMTNRTKNKTGLFFCYVY